MRRQADVLSSCGSYSLTTLYELHRLSTVNEMRLFFKLILIDFTLFGDAVSAADVLLHKGYGKMSMEVEQARI